MIKVTVWNEYAEFQKTNEECLNAYPNGLHNTISDFLAKDKDITTKISLLDDEDCGLSEEILKDTDVLVYWGHTRHGDVPDETAKRIKDHVNKGMGVVFLHSAHKSKAFMQLLGSTGNLQWREIAESERVWTANPYHPIAKDVPQQFELEHEEMYGEPFDIPEPASTVFIGWFKGGNVFRSGVTYHRGAGKVFYFQPGHETYKGFHNENVQKVITNAVKWAKSDIRLETFDCPNTDPLEKI